MLLFLLTRDSAFLNLDLDRRTFPHSPFPRLFSPAQTPRPCSHPLLEIAVCISPDHARIAEYDIRANNKSDIHAIVSATRNPWPNRS